MTDRVLDPYTVSVILRALGLRKIVIRARHMMQRPSEVEVQTIILPACDGVEISVLEPVIEGEAAG